MRTSLSFFLHGDRYMTIDIVDMFIPNQQTIGRTFSLFHCNMETGGRTEKYRAKHETHLLSK